MSGTDCSAYCVCDISPAVGTSLVECQTAKQPDADSSGWCYVSSTQGAAQAALVADCDPRLPQTVRFIGNAIPTDDEVMFIACQSTTTAPSAPAALGQTCVMSDESDPGFAGYNVREVSVDARAAQCSSNLCLANHFQGRASCPYGQVVGGGDCLLPGSSEPVSVPVSPQLLGRQPNVASICSCQCAGSGPGPAHVQTPCNAST